jgi:hypothetical protein
MLGAEWTADVHPVSTYLLLTPVHLVLVRSVSEHNILKSYCLMGSSKREIHPIEGIPTGRQISTPRFYSANSAGDRERVTLTPFETAVNDGFRATQLWQLLICVLAARMHVAGQTHDQKKSQRSRRPVSEWRSIRPIRAYSQDRGCAERA